MSDPLVEQLNRAFDTLAEQVRNAVSEHASVRVEQLSAAIQTERQSVAEQASRTAAESVRQAVTERLTADFAQRESQIRDEARTEGFAAGLTEGRAAAAMAESARSDAEQQRAEIERKLTDAERKLADIERHAADVERQRADAAAALEAARQTHAASLRDVYANHQATLARLADALRVLDSSTSLSQTLNALVDAATSHAPQTALFLVRGEQLRLWTQSGFDRLDNQPAFELPLADAGILAEAVNAGESRRAQAKPGAFSSREGGQSVAVPLNLDGQVTAVLYAESATNDDQTTAVLSTLDLLARHAARVLESLTAIRLAHAGGRQPANLATRM
jgi:hypothetical protein